MFSGVHVRVQNISERIAGAREVNFRRVTLPVYGAIICLTILKFARASSVKILGNYENTEAP